MAASKTPAKKSAAPAASKKAAGATAAPTKPVKKAARATAAPTKPVKKVASPAPAKAATPAPAAASRKKAPAAPVSPVAAAVTPVPPAAAKVPAKKAPSRLLTPLKPEFPPVKGVTKDGISYTKEFDVKFLTAQKTLLISERISLVGQASRLEAEATALIEESEMGDVQFDDEGGEGDTMVVERERDLALSAQARQTVADIDAAMLRLAAGTYGFSIESGRPIPRERLEFIPWATVLVEEKVGGIGRR